MKIKRAGKTLGKRTGEFPDWERLYREESVESMPWFISELDPDLEEALKRLNVKSGRALDLGTGPGTHAIALSELGFEVAATDISESAVKKAAERARRLGARVEFRQDDILNTSLDGRFDFVLDRGCFHVLPPERRTEYVKTVAGLLKPRGYLFLKCFSHLEPDEKGPYRFTPGAIVEAFGRVFRVISIEETVYQGTLKPLPRALFCVLQKP